ncbi:MAG: cytidine deaminase [Firmicutes bacterium]|nr:cytidine deaminase [Bacillota bacterium]MCM1401932.1 cytidine deaminase [Bacteroides sp.]MCM1477818.1 cytidine deaminase [Bacteroides sp.]
MKTKDIVCPIQAYTYEELPARVASLMELAREATYRSYAPYSHFCVGAAIRLSNGEIVTGANQENVAYPSGTCAERSACFYAHARYPEAKFEEIAIAARGTDGEFVAEPIAPCGACRQALLEYETLAGHPVTVWLAGRNEVYRIPSVASLLPLAFSEFD